MKHHYLALATALLAATGVQADAKGTMTVNGSGAGAAIPVSSISRITFDDHTMNVATADGGSQASTSMPSATLLSTSPQRAEWKR